MSRRRPWHYAGRSPAAPSAAAPSPSGRAARPRAAADCFAGGALVELADWRWIFLPNCPWPPPRWPGSARTRADDLSAAQLSTWVAHCTGPMALLGLVLHRRRDRQSRLEVRPGPWWPGGRDRARRRLCHERAALCLAVLRGSCAPSARPKRDRSSSSRQRGCWRCSYSRASVPQRVLGCGPRPPGLSFLHFSALDAIPVRADGRVPERVTRGADHQSCGPGPSWACGGPPHPGQPYGAECCPRSFITGLGLGRAFVPIIGWGPVTLKSADRGWTTR